VHSEEEQQITWQNTFRIWCVFLWVWFLCVIGGVILIVATVLLIEWAGYSVEPGPSYRPFVSVAVIASQIVALRVALRNEYRRFRVVLAPHNQNR
jgi:hypothetical protein